MLNFFRIPQAALLASILLSGVIVSPAQVTYSGNTIDLVVKGTSTLHNWEMKSVKANCTAVLLY